MEKHNRRKPGPKPDPNKQRTTNISVYLSERRKEALKQLAQQEDDGIIAVVVTRAIENEYGAQLDSIEAQL